MDDPTAPVVLHPYPLSEFVLGVPVAVEPDVYGLTMRVPVMLEPTVTVVVVSAVPPGETVVACL